MAASRKTILTQVRTWQRNGRAGLEGVKEELAALPVDSPRRPDMLLLRSRLEGSLATLDNVERLFGEPV
jgi:hypothetical protein